MLRFRLRPILPTPLACLVFLPLTFSMWYSHGNYILTNPRASFLGNSGSSGALFCESDSMRVCSEAIFHILKLFLALRFRLWLLLSYSVRWLSYIFKKVIESLEIMASFPVKWSNRFMLWTSNKDLSKSLRVNVLKGTTRFLRPKTTGSIGKTLIKCYRNSIMNACCCDINAVNFIHVWFDHFREQKSIVCGSGWVL